MRRIVFETNRPLTVYVLLSSGRSRGQPAAWKAGMQHGRAWFFSKGGSES